MSLALTFALALQTVNPDVVVTARRLEADHAVCAKGGCTPERDAQAAIAWAESQFRDGRYVAAKTILMKAPARNKRHAATHPRPVAAIYEAYATVAWQEGDQDVHRRAVFDRVRTLRQNLPADDLAVRAAASATGDMWMRLGDAFKAEAAYAAADREAEAAGMSDVALRLRLRRARLQHMLGNKKATTALLASAEALPGTDAPASRAAVRAMRLRLAAIDGDKAMLDRLTANLGDLDLARPVLIWAPPYARTALDAAQAGKRRSPAADLFDVRTNVLEPRPNGLEPRSGDIAAILWADIGFWIRPDGRTAEVELLRGSRDKAWAAPYLAQVAERRYSTTPVAAGQPGFYRIERFTIRGGYDVPANSLIRRRSGAGRLEVLDITDPPARIAAKE
jgi:hypothetical protein